MLADAGYAEVEIGGTYDGRTAAAFRELANGYGLKPEGSHVPGGGAAWRGNRAQIFADAAALGLRFYFHNHPEDFTLDGGTPIYDTLLEETDRRLVWFELDIAWIEAGGTRPGRAASTWRSSRCGAVASGRGGPGRRRRSW